MADRTGWRVVMAEIADVLKRAVEIAEPKGWGVIGDGPCYWVDYPNGDGTTFEEPEDIEPQWVAALAVDLTDMVRAIAKERKQPWLWTNLRHAVMGKSLDDDLRLNTITAIVEFYDRQNTEKE